MGLSVDDADPADSFLPSVALSQEYTCVHIYSNFIHATSTNNQMCHISILTMLKFVKFSSKVVDDLAKHSDVNTLRQDVQLILVKIARNRGVKLLLFQTNMLKNTLFFLTV